MDIYGTRYLILFKKVVDKILGNWYIWFIGLIKEKRMVYILKVNGKNTHAFESLPTQNQLQITLRDIEVNTTSEYLKILEREHVAKWLLRVGNLGYIGNTFVLSKEPDTEYKDSYANHVGEDWTEETELQSLSKRVAKLEEEVRILKENKDV